MAKMKAPENGIAVRMYRQGHGDCFLLALPRKSGGEPVYVLIDCGYKRGSQKLVHGKSIAETVAHIGESTGSTLDLVIITHEHEDHLNGFGTLTRSPFENFTIKEAWFAWTEDPNDALAEQLRQRHKDQLLLLVEARSQLALAFGDDDPSVTRLDSLLSLELGFDSASDGDFESTAIDPTLLSAFAAGEKIPDNKEAMKLIKDKAEHHYGSRYLKPENAPKKIRSSESVRVFVLGPPRDEVLLDSLDPIGSEAFPGANDAHGFSFGGALLSDRGKRVSPFNQHYHVSAHQIATHSFFSEHYGTGDDVPVGEDDHLSASNAAWRRIDDEWLFSAETLALNLNKFTNNTSLVLAIQLPQSKKTLLFAGDAQRGNWISWDDYRWKVGGKTVTTRDLLAHTVLYKAGHHGSHNATLDGQEGDTYPNLAWMGMGEAAAEFTAMITAVNKWAEALKPYPWMHPWASIKRALLTKARGRVFQTDTPTLFKPDDVTDAEWQRFLARATFDEMYFELQISDEVEEDIGENDDCKNDDCEDEG